MDFYNVIYIASNDPYHHGGIYPPLAYLAYYIIGLVALPDLPTPIDINNYDIKLTQLGEMCLFLFFAVGIFLFYKGLVKISKNRSYEKDLLFLILLLSPTMLFTIERGNINLITLGLVLVFVAGFNSENKYIRYVSTVCLALSTCTKIYVAIYALLLLRKDRVREFILFMGAAVILNTVPFLFIGGDPITYFNNLTHWASGEEMVIRPTSPSITEILYVLDCNTNYNLDYYGLSKIIKIVMIVLTTVTILFSDNKCDWKNIALLSILMICLGGNLGGYYQIYLIPAFLLFLNDNKTLTLLGIIYAATFVMMFICLPNDFQKYEFFYLTTKLTIIGTFVLYTLLIADKLKLVYIRLKTLLNRNKNGPFGTD